MKNKLIKATILLLALVIAFLLNGCSTNRKILLEIRDKVEKLPTQEQLFAFQKTFTALDSTIRSTQINVIQYEIDKTNAIYDSLRTDSDIIKRTNEILRRLRKPPPK